MFFHTSSVALWNVSLSHCSLWASPCQCHSPGVYLLVLLCFCVCMANIHTVFQPLWASPQGIITHHQPTRTLWDRPPQSITSSWSLTPRMPAVCARTRQVATFPCRLVPLLMTMMLAHPSALQARHPSPCLTQHPSAQPSTIPKRPWEAQ